MGKLLKDNSPALAGGIFAALSMAYTSRLYGLKLGRHATLQQSTYLFTFSLIGCNGGAF